ncbi:hypothetical protein ACO0RG_000919 [Hanseniaspora osmophila]|uniref:Translation machinery-associated protein 22 n=1 Tax=Hanseniaspora osmophila TaxID=56408 RepID=A0A1E5R1W9_9ASCO|nr:Translation machinery-associated protein 22 [Hanseniaspora osmophila]
MSVAHVVYCGVCSFPIEYCEFSGKLKKCKVWLQEEHPELFTKFYGSESEGSADGADGSGDGVDGSDADNKEKKLEKSLKKLEIKEENRDKRELQKKLNSKIVIKTIERTKRKRVVAITGLEVFEIDMKKLSKTFASKFATGCSVSKNVEKKEEIIVQGDVADQVEVYIQKLLQEKGMETVKVEKISGKAEKKKKTEDGAAPAK